MAGSLTAWRAALRIARRDAWRNKGRSALIAVMVALPVLAVSAADVVYRSAENDPRDIVELRLGDDAQALLRATAIGQRVDQSTDGENYGVASEGPGMPEPVTEQHAAELAAAVLSSRNSFVPDLRYYLSGTSVRIGDRVVDATVREFDYSQRGVAGVVARAADVRLAVARAS